MSTETMLNAGITRAEYLQHIQWRASVEHDRLADKKARLAAALQARGGVLARQDENPDNVRGSNLWLSMEELAVLRDAVAEVRAALEAKVQP